MMEKKEPEIKINNNQYKRSSNKQMKQQLEESKFEYVYKQSTYKGQPKHDQCIDEWINLNEEDDDVQ